MRAGTSYGQAGATAAVGLRSERGPVLLAVMLGAGLVAVDATILATAVAAVVDDLGGFTQFPWMFSIYLLAQAATAPIYGKLADLYGRKAVMLVGISLFVLGSLLCGLAWNMAALIGFRAVQGLGAGAVQPVGMTIIGDIYSLEERARVQGYLASVWAVASLLGPVLGGLFVDHLSWRGIFFVNLPVGAAAAWMVWRRFDERVTRARHRIDYAGSALLVGAGVLAILWLLKGGVAWAWNSAASLSVAAGTIACLVGFVAVERRAHEPVLPLWVFRRRVLNSAMTIGLVVGVLTLGLTTYIPLFAQRIGGASALLGGLTLAAMSLGWPLAASLAGRIYLTRGFTVTMLLGAVLATAGLGVLVTVSQDSSLTRLAVAGFLMGLGFGFTVSPSVVAAQSAVSWRHRGVVTGVTLFARSLGSAVGVAAFGAIVNATVVSGHGQTVDLATVPAANLAVAIHRVFLAAAVLAPVLLAVAAVMPRRIEEPRAD